MILHKSARALGSQPYAIDTEIKLIRLEEILVLCNVTLKIYLLIINDTPQ